MNKCYRCGLPVDGDRDGEYFLDLNNDDKKVWMHFTEASCITHLGLKAAELENRIKQLERAQDREMEELDG